MSDRTYPVIFPGWSTHDQETDATTTKHLHWIVKALNSWGVRGSELTLECRRMIERVFYLNGQKPGPLDWRIFAERNAGRNRELIGLLKAAEQWLHRLLTVGAERDAATRLDKIADELDAGLGNAPRDAQRRLHWLCCDMIERLESEKDDSELGYINPRIDESAALAVLLGFPSPPIQRTRYERDGANSIAPMIGRTWPDPTDWIHLRHRQPEVAYAFGYRVHDPAGAVRFDKLYCGIAEEPDPNKPKHSLPWAKRPKVDQREAIVSLLKIWMSAIAGLTDRAPLKAIAPSGEQQGTSEGKRLPPSREKAYRVFEWAVSENPDLKTDRAVYDWVIRDGRHADVLTYPFATFVRYLSDARDFYDTHKHTPRKGRTSRSVVRKSQL